MYTYSDVMATADRVRDLSAELAAAREAVADASAVVDMYRDQLMQALRSGASGEQVLPVLREAIADLQYARQHRDGLRYTLDTAKVDALAVLLEATAPRFD